MADLQFSPVRSPDNNHNNIMDFAEECGIKMLKNICILWSNAGTCPNDRRKMVLPSQQRMDISVSLHIFTALVNAQCSRSKNEKTHCCCWMMVCFVQCAVCSVHAPIVVIQFIMTINAAIWVSLRLRQRSEDCERNAHSIRILASFNATESPFCDIA